MASLLVGMVSAFQGMVFKDIRTGIAGWVPVLVMLVSVLVMLILGVLIRFAKLKWLEEYALPLSMLLSMASAIPLTGWLS